MTEPRKLSLVPIRLLRSIHRRALIEGLSLVAVGAAGLGLTLPSPSRSNRIVAIISAILVTGGLLFVGFWWAGFVLSSRSSVRRPDENPRR